MSAPAAPEDTAPSPAVWRELPLVDPSVLEELELQLENRGAVRIFVNNFIDLWPERYGRLVGSLAIQDQVALHDAVLSLKVTSMMIGAPQLAYLSVELEAAIWGLNLDTARTTLNEMERTGARTIQKLQRIWERKAD